MSIRTYSGAHPYRPQCVVIAWPTDEDDGSDSTRKEYESELAARLQTQAHAAYTAVHDGTPVVVTADAVFLIRPRPHPGGWLEHGYDDAADEQERRS